MKILGIDPGYDRLGIAIIESQSRIQAHYLSSECFTTNNTLEFNERLALIVGHIDEVFKQEQPNALVLELLYINSNQKTVMFVAEVRGALKTLAHIHRIPIYEMNPLQIKSAITGHGQASKSSVAFMIPKLITLPTRKMIDDEVDAIGIALAGVAHFSLF
ncbi:MAG TPA: crossover junction endodeoxyribonuclease RuvC [Candidatus Paceibacterota bacterium]